MTTWTAPATAAPGGLTSAYLNTNVRDNSLYLKEVVDGTNAAKVAVAAEAIRPQARVYHNAAQSMGGIATRVVFNSERWDTDAIHDLVSGLGFGERLTAKTRGLYLVTAHIQWASNATGYRQVYFKVNGTTDIAINVVPAVNGLQTVQFLATPYQLSVNDYVECWVLQNSGGNLNIESAGNSTPEFSLTFLSNF